MCDYRQGMDWWMDLLKIYMHHSKLQAITALSLIFTPYKSPQNHLSHFPACYDFICRSLRTVSNSGDSPASRAQVLSPQPQAQNYFFK
jgi:hypothetical protein